MRDVFPGTEPTTRVLTPLTNEAALAAIPARARRDGMMAELTTPPSGPYVWCLGSVAPAASGMVVVPNDISSKATYIADATSEPGRWENRSTMLVGVPQTSARLYIGTALAATRVGGVLTANANGALGAIDGKTPAVNDRVLVGAQSTGADNGIYALISVGAVGSKYSMVRVGDLNDSVEAKTGMAVFITEGDTYGGEIFELTTLGPITINTTALTFRERSATHTLTATVSLAQLQAAGAVKVYNFAISAAALPANAVYVGGEISGTLVDDATDGTAVLDIGWSGTAGALASAVDICSNTATGFPKAPAGASAFIGGTAIGAKTILGKITTGVNLSTLTAGAFTIRIRYSVGG